MYYTCGKWESYFREVGTRVDKRRDCERSYSKKKAREKSFGILGIRGIPPTSKSKQHKTAGATAAESVSFAVFLFLAARSPRLEMRHCKNGTRVEKKKKKNPTLDRRP